MTHLFLVVPLALVIACGEKSVADDQDTSADTDTDTDTNTSDPSVLLDEIGFIPGPESCHHYASYTFDVDPTDTWVRVFVESDQTSWMYGALYAPSESCSLQVPALVGDTDEHWNEGYILLSESGTHTLLVYGEAPTGGTQIHATVTRVEEADLPMTNEESCSLGAQQCACTDACNCATL